MIGLLRLAGWRGAVLASVLAGAAGFAGGWRVRDLGARAAEARAAEAAMSSVVADERRRSDLTQAVSEQAEAAQHEIRWRTRTLIREVPVHVTIEDDARCIVPVGFVRLHDAAAASGGEVSEPARKPDDAPSGVALSAVAETVVDNYGTCESARRQLIDLQAWIRAQLPVGR